MRAGIIDAHMHIWDLNSQDYGWITPESFAPLARSFGLDDVRAEREELGIQKVILVQAADTDGDTDRMLSSAAIHPEVAGVVAWLPLDDRERLESRINQLLASGLVVGVRALIHNMPDPEWVLRTDVAAGLDRIAALGWAFDIVTAGPKALTLIPRLARRHPGLRLVIDHLGKPPLGGSAASFTAWSDLLREAAEMPMVAAKLSGFAATGPVAAAWGVDDLRPALEVALDAFGPERLMLGGDWPVARLAGGYSHGVRSIWAALNLEPRALDAINRDTATTWYRLNDLEKQ